MEEEQGIPERESSWLAWKEDNDDISFAFWNLLEYFFLNIFDLWLVESMVVE